VFDHRRTRQLKAYQSALTHEPSATAETRILPAIDVPLFQKLLERNFHIEGPHEWQVTWWAKLSGGVPLQTTRNT
jgi:hypothetical protein